MKCLSDSEISKGYYQENNIYYPCMSHCDICSNDLTCQACAEGYDYEDSKCNKHINRIDNCEEYDEEGICFKCIENYAFKKKWITGKKNLLRKDLKRFRKFQTGMSTR